MDIAIVTTRLTENDAQGNFTAASLSAIKERCHGRVSIYTFAYERPPIDGIAVNFVSGKNSHGILSNFSALLRTFKYAKEFSAYDMLMLIGPDVGILPAVHLARRRDHSLKRLWVYHGQTPAEFLTGCKERTLMKLRKAAYICSMKRSDLVQAFSEYVKGELSAAGVDQRRIVVAPLGVDLSRFSAGDRNGLRAQYDSGDSFLILYVGRLAALKRVDELVRAMALLKGENVRLMVVGAGPERERLQALAESLGVAGRVTFAGRVSDEELPDYYAACDAWATASRHEGFCVPIVEALAAGKPAIVPDVAAMAETAGDAGLVYRSGDVEDLVKKIAMLKGDGELYRSLSARAVDRARSFDMKKVLGDYADMVLGSR